MKIQITGWFILSLLISNPLWSYQVICIGDSLTEGYSLKPEHAYPALVQERLKKINSASVVTNAGISGATSQIALSQVKKFVLQKPDLIILALGANDGLRGLPAAALKKNLEQAIQEVKKNKIPLLLVGMMIPPNYGPAYTQEFKTAFAHLAKKYQIPLMPFLLEGVAGQPQLNLPDQIHPNEKGHQIIAKNIWPYIKKALKVK